MSATAAVFSSALLLFQVVQDEIDEARYFGVAIMNAADAYGRKPKNIQSKDGRPLLSWRVETLPFYEQQPLFDEFHRDEAWDSEHNKALLKKRIRTFRTKYADDENSTTWKLLPDSPGGVMLVEGGRGSSVIWSQPDEVKIDPKKPLASFGEEPAGGYLVILSDGRVQKMDGATLAQRLKPTINHKGLKTIAIDRDGKVLATADNEGKIILWDLVGATIRATLVGHTDCVLGLAFSPDGKTLASSSRDKTIKLWNAADGKLVSTLEGHTSDIHSVTFHPAGNGLASGSWDGTVRLWNKATGKNTKTIEVPAGGVFAVTFSPNGRQLASAGGGDYGVSIWNVATGKSVAVLAGHEATVLALAFSPDGKQLASSDIHGVIKLWNVAKPTTDATLLGHEREVYSLVFERNGKGLISAGQDQTIRIWDLASGKVAKTLQAAEPITSLVVHPSAPTLFSGGAHSGLIQAWQLPLQGE